MATAAAGIASLFSSSINTVKCLRSRTCMIAASSLSQSSYYKCSIIEPLSIGTTISSHKLWMPRISTAVAQKEAVVAAEEHATTKLYIGNLPFSVDSAQLAGLIEDYGGAELIEVLYDRDTGKSRGFAFVTMSSIEDCHSVIKNLDGKEFNGRSLRVNFSGKPKPKEPLYPETEFKLFIGNLAWTVTAEILTQAFEEHGTVVGARVIYDGETGRSRGYGFVCYSNKLEMEAALTVMNEVELEGRTLRVSLAQGKRQ